MGFILDIVEAIVDVIIAVVEIVVQIVEVIIELVMVLLGYDETTQVIEYFDIHNVRLFNDVDNLNPLLEVVRRSILSNQDIAEELIYAQTFQSYKGDIQDFINYIDDGNYIEDFPVVESYITYPDITEITAVLLTLTGVACTPENSYTKAPTASNWVEYWLQENKSYSFEDKALPDLPGTSYVLTINDEIATEDDFTVNAETPITTSPASTSSSFSGTSTAQNIDLSTIVYNSGPDNYSVDVYDDFGNYSTLPYTIPSKPTGLHYISYYYINSVPAITYMFLYKVGTGTYPTLDDPQNEIGIDGSTLHAIPAIPLRLNNADYTTRPAAEVTKIEALCDLLSIDAGALLNAIKNDPDAPGAGDLDHIYINFGVRLWDSSQTGMAYLFNMCENLFPSQGSTKGNYDSTPTGDDKPQNNIIITLSEYKYIFQFSYISYEFTTLAVIDGAPGSPENGYYYSDMSRFTAGGLLYNPYFVSSGKGTYNVGYKADNLTEVANFLSGSGTVNPGTTTGEATNWLQVTGRMVYNDPTPVLKDADNTTSALVFLTPDLVYENNGSGVLRHVEAASEETTAGQSITYYRAISSGLEAYTMVAPMSSTRVVDGESGKFKMVKANLGAQDDLMAPFIHNFIANRSNKDVTQLFLAGSHASLYIASYEVIIQRTSLFSAIITVLIIVIIVVVIVYYPPAASFLGEMSPVVFSASGSVALGATTMNILASLAVNQIVKLAVTSVLGDGQVAQIIGTIAGMVAASGTGYGLDGFTVDYSGITELTFKSVMADWDWTDTAKLSLVIIEMGTGVVEYRNNARVLNELGEIEREKQDSMLAYQDDLLRLTNESQRVADVHRELFGRIEEGRNTADMLRVSLGAYTNGGYAADQIASFDNILHLGQIDTNYDVFFQRHLEASLLVAT
jgi:hypothetical protein